MANFYSNENFPIPIVLELRKLGHDILTIQETGKSGIAFPDEEVLAERSIFKYSSTVINAFFSASIQVTK